MPIKMLLCVVGAEKLTLARELDLSLLAKLALDAEGSELVPGRHSMYCTGGLPLPHYLNCPAPKSDQGALLGL